MKKRARSIPVLRDGAGWKGGGIWKTGLTEDRRFRPEIIQWYGAYYFSGRTAPDRIGQMDVHAQTRPGEKNPGIFPGKRSLRKAGITAAPAVIPPSRISPIAISWITIAAIPIWAAENGMTFTFPERAVFRKCGYYYDAEFFQVRNRLGG
jgi:hypothetical protein